MARIRKGDTIVILKKVKGKNKWRKKQFIIDEIHSGKNFITVTNGIYRDTLDVWDLQQKINKGTIKVQIFKAVS